MKTRRDCYARGGLAMTIIGAVLLVAASVGGTELRMKCGTVTADSANDWYYTRGLNGGAHNPSANDQFLYNGFTGAFQRRSARCFPGVTVPKDATIDSAFLMSLWVTTDSTIKPVQLMYGVSDDAYDTICDSTRWVSAYALRTTAVDSMYDSLWARAWTATWARSWNVKTILQELVNTAWWQSGDTAVFVAEPRAGSTGDRTFRSLNSGGGGDSLIVYYTVSGGGGGGGTGPRALIRK